MKFKAGDKVKVREDLKMYQCITSNMLKYKGRVLTIEDVSNDFYILRECGRMIHWTDDMLELVEVKNCDMDKKIKDTIKTWEDWKIDEYNNNFAVSHLNEKLPYNKQNKFKHFTDDELYILKR